MSITETAYAKINLALHVRGKRDDGYHELETLFAFVDAGDVLTARASETDRLETFGEFADMLDNPFDNLVARAMTSLPREGGLHVTLEKNLPVAAGLGGGSADAGAMFRIIEQTHGLPDDWEEKAVRLGADVPACVRSDMVIGRGTGTELEPIENDMAGMAVLLVNPRIPLPTGPVFQAWADVTGAEDRGPLPTGSARAIALAGRNDLEEPAVTICPPIAEVLQALAETDCLLKRMSGSGATCFSLYGSDEAMRAGADAIAAAHPDWWQMQGHLR